MNPLLSARINQLRAIAAIWVFIFHYTHFIVRPYFAPLASHNPFKILAYYGYTGVSLFFCLSGFLFAQAYCSKSHLAIADYYAKRLLRILPGFTVMMVIYFLCLNATQETLLHLLGNIFYFDVSVYPQSVRHLWSINRELQCYALFPWLWLIYRRYQSLALLILAAVSLGITLLWAHTTHPLLPYFYGTFSLRLYEFILGMLAGIHFTSLPKYRLQLPVLLASYILLLSYQHAQTWQTPLAFSYAGIVWLSANSFFCLLFIVYFLQHTEVVPKLIYRVLEKIGATSYSFYLYHFLIIVFFAQHRQWLSSNNNIDITILFGISILVAYLSYRWIETPAMRIKQRFFHQDFSM